MKKYINLKTLVCVAAGVLVAYTWIPWPEPAANVEVNHKLKGFIITGPIDADISDRYNILASKYPEYFTVLINSDGGRLSGGMSLGKSIHDNAHVTVVSDRCFSACGIAFMGGHRKYVINHAPVGFHRPYLKEPIGDRFKDDDYFKGKGKGLELLSIYWGYVDAAPDLYFRMIGADSDEMYIPNKEDALTYGFENID